MVAGGTWLFPVKFGGEWAATHPGAIGFGDAQDVVQHAGANPRTGGCIAGHTVAGGHVRVGAVVDIEQRALCTFKKQVSTFKVGFIEFTRHVSHHGFEQLSVVHGLVKNSLKLNLAVFDVGCQRGAKIKGDRAQIRGKHVVVQIKQFMQLGGKPLGVLQILHAQGTPGNLVFVGGADTTASGADLGIAALLTCHFTGHIERRMERQNQGASLADAQARAHFYAGFFQAFNFFKQLGG